MTVCKSRCRAMRSPVDRSRPVFRLLALASLVLSLAAGASCSSKPIVPFTTEAAPLALLPIERAGIEDRRGRFREITCAVLEAHGESLPNYRPCDEALVRVGVEPPGTGAPVNLGPARRPLTAAFVPGIGWECLEGWLKYEFEFINRLDDLGHSAFMFEVDGLSGTENNARQIRDAIIERAEPFEPESLVLIGYSKGAPDILAAIVEYPEIQPFVAAVVSVAGAIGGSPLANDATEGQLDLLRHMPEAECSAGDGRGVESLRPAVRQKWLADHPLPAHIPFYSLVTYPMPDRISSVLEATHRKLARVDPRNDSQVIFYDQIIPGSTLLGYLNADHWAVAVPIAETHPFVGRHFVDQNDYPRKALTEALIRFVEEDLEGR